jgi:hypothetical protein
MTLQRPDPVDMTPDENGLFSLPQVTMLADERRLLTSSTDSNTVCEVQKSAAGQPVQVVATQPGLWGPVEIFRACREALGEKSYEVGHGKITNPRGLNEVRIASVIGADGINPYLTQKTWHYVCHLDGVERFWTGPKPTLFQAHIRAKFPEYFGQVKVRAQAGDWTQPMLFVMCDAISNFRRNSKYRRALYALREAGLMHYPIGGTYEWTELAMIQPPKPKLTAEDAAALNALVA